MHFSDYDVHGYIKKEQPNDCTYNTIKTYSKMTPSQCADECNKEKNCASFLYKMDDDNPQCWTKARHCDQKKASPNKVMLYYDKIGHPGTYRPVPKFLK